VRANLASRPVYQPRDKGGLPFVQGIASGIRRVIRNPLNEHEGWNTVEIIARGDEVSYVINGKVNNSASHLEEIVDNKWVPLKQGKIGLQLEFAEVEYRNVEIRELKE
jgi:hypothetical protein